MTRKAGYIIGGTVAWLLAATFAPTLESDTFGARGETFDARWIAISSTPKQDRLPAPRASGEIEVVAITDTQTNTTVLTKTEVAEKAPKPSLRELPHDSARKIKKEKLPVGCDPSFSPVTQPSLAHLTGRCLASAESGQKFAALVR